MPNPPEEPVISNTPHHRQVERLAKWIGAVTALIAIISLAVSIYSLNADINQQ